MRIDFEEAAHRHPHPHQEPRPRCACSPTSLLRSPFNGQWGSDRPGVGARRAGGGAGGGRPGGRHDPPEEDGRPARHRQDGLRSRHLSGARKYGSEVYSSEVKKTEVLMVNFRRDIGLRIKENKEVYEGEVTELSPEEAEGTAGGYGKSISHVIIGLKTVKGTKQMKLDPTIYDA